MSARTLAALIAVASVSMSGDLIAQTATAPPPSEDRCLEAYEKGQRLRLKNELLEARAELLLCARAPCPESFRPECLRWYDEVQAQVPSVIVRLDGGAGDNVRVLVDGVLVASRLDATPIEIDPGAHVVRCEIPGSAPLEQKVLVVPGEKARILTFAAPSPKVIAPSPATPTPETSSHGSVAPWIFVGVSAVALASFAYFGATGVAKRSELQRCNPYCLQSDVDDAHRRYLVANVSLGVAAVSVGIATYLFLTSTPTHESAEASVHVDAGAMPSGGFVGVSGAF